MLTSEDNERLTRVSAGTPMGKLMRRYWQPALLSSEVSEPDGAPVRVRLLGENLIGFRDTSDRVGLVDAYCPHRRAPLFFGRNEECGLRCVYHGWKFDASGNCVDLPTEPASSNMKNHIKIIAYPTHERAGIVWAYLGPRAHMPAPPDFEWMRAPQTHRHVSKTFEHCNWLQALEGGLDTAHSSYLHNNKLGDDKALRQRDRAPTLEVEKTDYGYTYVSHRKAGEEGSYVRVYHYVMPWQAMRGGVANQRGRNRAPTLDGHLWVPIDDEQTYVYNWMCGIDQYAAIPPEKFEERETFAGRGPDDLIPGTFALKKNPSNDYFIDRTLQKTINYSGIVGLNTQDFALQEGMGPICDRTRENLGSTDRAIIAMRLLLLEAIDAAERNDPIRGVDPRSHCAIRPFDAQVPPGADWRAYMAEDLRPKW